MSFNGSLRRSRYFNHTSGIFIVCLYITYLTGHLKEASIQKYIPFLSIFSRVILLDNILLDFKKSVLISISIELFFKSSNVGLVFSSYLAASFVRCVWLDSFLESFLYSSLIFIKSDLSIVLISVSLIKIIIKFYNDSIIINSKLVKQTALLTARMFGAIILPITSLIFYSFFNLQENLIHTDESLNRSLKYQFNLKNFDIRKGFEKGHNMSIPKDNLEVETDEYVMDRSQIALISMKYNGFFEAKDKIYTSKKFNMFAEIHKIHQEDFDNEEPRFIKNGDFVKFKALNSDKFVAVKKEDGEQKFTDLQLGTFDDDEDMWIVECDSYLKARLQDVKFRSVKSGEYLSVRKDSSLGLYASQYSELLSRRFMISYNINHVYFKTNYKDEKSRIKIEKFKGSEYLDFFLEHTRYLKGIKESKQEEREVKQGIGILILAIFFTILKIANFISEQRYGLSIKFRTLTHINCLVFTMFLIMQIKTKSEFGVLFKIGEIYLIIVLIDLFNQKKLREFKPTSNS